MKKIGIEIDEKNQFLYAFCCTAKDYKLVWHLNNNMRYKYRKDKDIPFYSEKLNKKIYFTQYKDKENNNTTIIYNKNKEGFLVSELKSFDFLILFNWTPDTSGQYQITLQVITNQGCEHFDTRIFELLNPPTASFLFDPTFCEDTLVQFNNTSSPSNPTNQITNILWDFGDGDTSNVSDPLHAYSTPGFYFVTLDITDNQYCQSIITDTIEIFQNPTVDFSASTECLNTATTFINNSQIVNNTNVIYNWSYLSSIFSNDIVPQGYAHSNCGDSIPINLEVIDGNGCYADTGIGYGQWPSLP